MSFPQEYDATITASEDLDLPPHFTSTFRSIKQQPAFGSKQSSYCVQTRFTGSLFESVSKEERSRPKRCANIKRQNLHKILERKAELAVRGEKLAQLRLYEAEADMEVKHWEKRNSDIALYDINQEFESQR